MLVIMAGLPGTGKSTIARQAAGTCGGVVLDKDQLRVALFPSGEIEYSAGQDDFVMELMLQTAQWLWQRQPGRVVFLDGRTFSRAYQRARAIEASGGRYLLVECRCRAETAIARIEHGPRHPAANRNAALYRQLAREFEPISGPKLVIDSESPLDECVAALEAALPQRPAR